MYQMLIATAFVYLLIAGLCKLLYRKPSFSDIDRLIARIVLSAGVLLMVAVHAIIVFGLFDNWGGKVVMLLFFFLPCGLPQFMKLVPKYIAFMKRRDERGVKLGEQVVGSTSTSQTISVTWRVTTGDEAEMTSLEGLMQSFLIAAGANVGYIVASYLFKS